MLICSIDLQMSTISASKKWERIIYNEYIIHMIQCFRSSWANVR